MAGLRLAVDVACRQLGPFAATGVAAGPFAAAPANWDGGTPGYAGPGWVGGRLRRVESWRSGNGYLLRIEGAGEYLVRGDGSEIVSRRCLQAGGPSEAVAAAVLGPCLVLAMALHGVWCLHASAAGAADRVVALAGESGSGKSTLAAALASLGGIWRRVGDDLLPVRLAGDGGRALPRFPQPKLAPELQWLPPAPEEVELAALYLLAPDADEVEVRQLSRRRAAEVLVGQTVAARLFDAELQARHLDFCAGLAGVLPVRTLRFPRRRAALPAMTTAIVAGFDG
ncbi:MAG: hypothetical protein ACE5EG_09355 [Thermoanaerobaculia bacterium]